MMAIAVTVAARLRPEAWQQASSPRFACRMPLKCPFHGLPRKVPGTLAGGPPNGGFKAVGEKNRDGRSGRGVVNRTHRTSGGSSVGRFPSALASRRCLIFQRGGSRGGGGGLMPDRCVLSVERPWVPFKAGRSRARPGPVLLKRGPQQRLRNGRDHALVLFG